MKRLLKYFISVFFLLISLSAYAAPEKEYWGFWDQSNEESTEQIDHSDWQILLDKYLRYAEKRRMYLFVYGGVSQENSKRLKSYLSAMTALDPRKYSKKEQMAYWINLYNAMTVNLILKNYPVKSITRLGKGWFRTGPWKDKMVKVLGHELSLDDIEHKIIRPMWKNPRVHFAINCASIGCPDLAPKAYNAKEIDKQLNEAAERFINQTKGVNFIGGRLVISKIFDWYGDDFGEEKGVKKELIRFALPNLKKQLQAHRGGFSYQYDWKLNEFRR